MLGLAKRNAEEKANATAQKSNSSQTQGTSQVTGNMTDGFTIEGTTVQGKSTGFFGRLWGGVKKGASSAWNSVKSIFTDYEISGEINASVGVQAGVEVNTPLGGVGIEANAISVDLGSASKQNILEGAEKTKTTWIGKDYWMSLRQGVAADFIVGGSSIERTMLSPSGGGAFFDKKIAEETKVLGYYSKDEYYQQGLFTTPQKPDPQHTNGYKFGFGLKFGFGITIDFDIHKKR
jgi:hypothetical protein